MTETRIMRFQFPEIRRHAELDAETRAARLVAEAHRDAHEIRREAEDEYATWRAQAEAEAELAVREEYASACLRAVESEHNALRKLEEAVIPLVLMATERLLGEAYAAEPGRVETLVHMAIEKLELASEFSIEVRAEDVAGMRARFAHDERVAIVACDDLSPGECRVSTDVGDVDATFTARLEALSRALHANPR